MLFKKLGNHWSKLQFWQKFYNISVQRFQLYPIFYWKWKWILHVHQYVTFVVIEMSYLCIKMTLKSIKFDLMLPAWNLSFDFIKIYSVELSDLFKLRQILIFSPSHFVVNKGTIFILPLSTLVCPNIHAIRVKLIVSYCLQRQK